MNSDLIVSAPWYKTAIFYELNVATFYDSNNDGIGDLAGLTFKLPYLKWLGINCIWLLPFYASPLRDGGYDVSNFLEINSEYGTLDDFKYFIKIAHEHNIYVITDFIISHTSDQHYWFKQSCEDPNGIYKDYYIWSDDNTQYSDARIIFNDTETSNWTYNYKRGQFYWHRFFSHQPHLNYYNENVKKDMLNTIRYWLDIGVDGFRLDSVPYIYPKEGTNCEGVLETHLLLNNIRDILDREYKDKVLLAEANGWQEDTVKYFGKYDKKLKKSNECQMVFHFPLMPRIFMSVRRENRFPISDVLFKTPNIPEDCQWGLFLRNHDELTLEKVSDDDRDYMYKEYARDIRMKANVGIRRRLAPLLDGSISQIKLFYTLLMTLKGSPIIYYGDEIGMGDNIWLGDRDGVRTPMQWNIDRNAGFSICNPGKLILPVVMDSVYGYHSINVESQMTNISSLLHYIRNLIKLRGRYKHVFGLGDYKEISNSNPSIFAFVRSYNDSNILCVFNLSRFPQQTLLDLSYYGENMTLCEVQGYTKFNYEYKNFYMLTCNEYGFYILRIESNKIK